MAELKSHKGGETITIGPCSPPDAANLADLHSRCFDNGWSEESFSVFIGNDQCITLKATAGPGNGLAGLVIARIGSDEAEILTLAVAPEYRRRRIANHLVEETTRLLADKGVQRLFLEVGVANTAASRLYDGLAFIHYGTRRNYYRRPGQEPEDALCLSLDLSKR